MKIPRFVIEILKKKVERENGNKVRNLVIDNKYLPLLDVPYLDDNNDHHKFDVYHTPLKDKKRTLVIDIHGGAYLFGHRRENYTFGTVFLDAGFDFIATDYIANDGTMDTIDLIDQNIKCISYILSHMKELGFDNDYNIVLTGDSAGGHMALTISELFLDKTYQKELGYDLAKMNLKAVLLNCPVSNFKEVGFDSMTKKANIRMFGPRAFDVEARKKICPLTHIDSLTVPLFASTCKHDFLRQSESLKLKEVVDKTNIKFTFIDLDTDEKGVSHVHNILDLNLEGSKVVNKAMIRFIDENIK